MAKITLDDLAIMVAKGFSSMDERFDRLEARMGRMIKDVTRHDRMINNIEDDVAILKSS